MLREYDCVVIGVDHDCFDYDLVFDESRTVVDSRGRAKNRSGRHIFRA